MWSNGTLLGQPASVRFTPVAFHWNYGDGNARNPRDEGRDVGALGIPEFGATPTSHVYATEGAYTIRLTIDFAPSTGSRAVRTTRSRASCRCRPTICT